MNTKKFNEVVEAQIKLSTDVLVHKAKEYATDDRLHIFKVAAELQGFTPKEALAGMMAKHTVSVYDMCVSNEGKTLEMWSEKITDSINYLLLLRAVVEEEMMSLTSECLVSDDSQFKMASNPPADPWMKANPNLEKRTNEANSILIHNHVNDLGQNNMDAMKKNLIRNPFGGGRSL